MSLFESMMAFWIPEVLDLGGNLTSEPIYNIWNKKILQIELFKVPPLLEHSGRSLVCYRFLSRHALTK